MKKIKVLREQYESVYRVYEAEVEVPDDFDLESMDWDEQYDFWSDSCEHLSELKKEKFTNNEEEFYEGE